MNTNRKFERWAVALAVVVMVVGWALAGGPGVLAAMFISFSALLIVAGFRNDAEARVTQPSATIPVDATGDLRPVILTRDPGELRPASADRVVTA